jgi:hypothetical protein
MEMKPGSVQITVDIPASLYRKLKEQAELQGHSVQELILVGFKATLFRREGPKSKKVQFPLIASHGPKVNLTNEQIYERVKFP